MVSFIVKRGKQIVTQIVGPLTSSTWEGGLNKASKTTQYFFIGGAARTGTTLLQSILCADEAVNPLITEASPIRFLLETHAKMKNNYEKFPGMYFDSITEIDTLYSQWLHIFLERLKSKYQCKYLALKEPQLTKFFPLLHEILGHEVKFLCMVRDPRAAIASMLVWGEKMRKRGVKHFFQERDMEKLAQFYNSFYIPLFAYKSEGFKKCIIYIRYEDLVSKPDDVINEVRKFTGLKIEGFKPDAEWRRTKVDFKDPNLAIRDAVTELYGKPITNSRIDAYQQILTEKEIDIIKEKCRFIFRTFGYEMRS